MQGLIQIIKVLKIVSHLASITRAIQEFPGFNKKG